MRRIWLAICWLFLSLFWAGAYAEQPFSVPGFSYSPLSGGTHFFRCDATRCGVGSGISFEKQNGPQDIAVLDYEQYARRAHAAHSPGRALTFGKAFGSKVGKRRVVQISFVATGSGQKTFWMTGFLLGSDKRISLVVSAPSASLARWNFDLFAKRLSTW